MAGSESERQFLVSSQYATKLRDTPAELARKPSKYELVPATLVGRVAVSFNFRGRGFAASLLMGAPEPQPAMTRQVASTAVIVDANDHQALGFYRKYGFIELPKLSMVAIEELFRNEQ